MPSARLASAARRIALAALATLAALAPARAQTLPIALAASLTGIGASAGNPVLQAARLAPGQFARRQQVIHTGIFLNEISRVDIAAATFTADFYIWLRFAAATPGAADATDLDFPDLVRGSFDRQRPAEAGTLDDGTAYRLWRVRGDFKNDFDLHHYPFDRQTLLARLFNARASSDQAVYVQDRRSIGPPSIDLPPAPAPAASGGSISAEAFRNLTQWNAVHAAQRRDVLVTASALGDPRRIGVSGQRELSGYRIEVSVSRRTVATLAKTLLPLGIMTLIMFAALFFPHGLVKEKITVAITGSLSGAVLLSSVNAQLGAVGYTMAVEYVFYIFFGLCLLSILSVLVAERQRVAGRAGHAVRTEIVTRGLYLASMLATLATALIVADRW